MTERRVVLSVDGIDVAGGYRINLERRLAGCPGIRQVYVDPVTVRAYVEYDPDVALVWSVAETIREAGYDVAVERRSTRCSGAVPHHGTWIGRDGRERGKRHGRTG